MNGCTYQNRIINIMPELNFWVTFDTVASLQSSGLYACKVWFQQPVYVFVKRSSISTVSEPFGGGDQRMGINPVGWRAKTTENLEVRSVSFGKVFGTKGRLSDEVWSDLCSFFGNSDISKWDLNELRDGCKPENFIRQYKIKYELV